MGKLHISAGSTEEKIRDTYAEVSATVEETMFSDAASRNSLYKIHVSLGKIVNSLDEHQPASTSRKQSSTFDHAAMDDKVDEEASKIKEEEDNDDDDSEGTVIAKYERDATADTIGSDETEIRDS